jgi:hypothetical protein
VAESGTSTGRSAPDARRRSISSMVKVTTSFSPRIPAAGTGLDVIG